ncbi:MAG: hypothetical protein NWE92_10870 [Candidatus Bathyarchaeota archaeon]|nr:hypothetical protein [Candidatus Bathyarchaeota archaeon]
MDLNTINLVKVRAFLLTQARDWFKNNGYLEVQSPIIVPALTQSSNSFEVKYYDKGARLTKGFLPYGLAFSGALGNVYTLTPGFRIEQPSKRHLTEYWRLEALQTDDFLANLKIQENLIAYLCQSLPEIKEALSCLHKPNNLATIEAPFSRLTYDEAIEMLQADGFDIQWGEEIAWAMERHLSFKFEKPFFIWKFPYGPETFFAKQDPAQDELSLTADLIAPEGFGEISSSLELITDSNKMSQLITEAGMDKQNSIWLSSMIPNNLEHCSAFALGVERFIQWICKIPEIKQTVPFPRLPDEVYP